MVTLSPSATIAAAAATARRTPRPAAHLAPPLNCLWLLMTDD